MRETVTVFPKEQLRTRRALALGNWIMTVGKSDAEHVIKAYCLRPSNLDKWFRNGSQEHEGPTSANR